jgi:hypothetical protein
MPATPSPLLRSIVLSAAFFIAPCIASPASAQPSQPVDNGTCAVCTSKTRCEMAGASGANSCTVTAGSGCQYDLSICVVAIDRATRELKVDPAEMLMLDGQGAVKLALAPVGGSRYAAWSCAGELIRVVEKRRDGRIVELPVARFRARYAYARLVEQAVRSGRQARRA